MEYAHIKAQTEAQFVQGAVLVMQSQIQHAILKNGYCTMGLSGGSTPQPIYELLGKDDTIDWSKVFVFAVDERYVPRSHPDSNQTMIRNTLLQHADIPEENIAFPDTSLPLQECVHHYEVSLKSQWLDRKPDIITLGIGVDGHIASLFPPLAEDALAVEPVVIHTTTDQFAVHDRITITLPTIANAKAQVFTIKGQDKKIVWEEMIQSREPVKRWPAKYILEKGSCTLISLW